jgi:phosphoribosylformylglycinamidine cyclo-ligase
VSEQQPKGFTYERAGVDNTGASRAKDRIGDLIRQTYTKDVLGDFGHFGGMFRSPGGGSSILVSSADSVGTKVLLAVHAGQHGGIGIDLVNHSVNDILCCGARPLFFLDYFATSSLNEEMLAEIVAGMTSACRESGCALIGGETAQLPGIYQESTYDLAGFIVGVVDEQAIIDGSRIEPGHVIVGLASNGLHTNGYSLARAVLGLADEEPGIIQQRLSEHVPELGESLGDALLRPHKPYLDTVYPWVEQGGIAGMAHVTGGGIVGNLSRIIPDNCSAVIDPESWETPALFELIQARGDVSTSEMFDVFNMGIGFVLVTDQERASQILGHETGAWRIGEIRQAGESDKRVVLGEPD